MQTYEEEVLPQFLKNTAEHELTVLHDEGLYRHVRMAEPGTMVFHYDIITYPGYLTVVGDMGSFTFSRVEDMFKFFRCEEDGKLHINPGYWAEKLVAVDRNSGYEEYSSELFLETVERDIRDRWDLEGDELEEAVAHVSEEAAPHCENEYQAREFGFEYESPNGRRFRDFWEYNLRVYTYHYIWLLYGIVHAIQMYDALREVAQSER